MADRSQSTFTSQSTLTDAIQAQLEAARNSISRELKSIPPPVPACDVNFNRLLEDRASIVDDLQRLAKLRSASVQDIDLLGFVRACAWLDAETKARIEQALSAAESR